MGFILEKIEEAIKELLIGWIESNLTNMFTDVNDKVGTIAAEVGKTPSTWDSSIYQMIRGLSENVIVPIAGIIITSYYKRVVFIDRSPAVCYTVWDAVDW